MIERVDISLLEKYLDGNLERSQLLDVEGKPLNDEQVEKAMAEYKEVMLHLEGAALKAQLKEKYSDAQVQPRKRLAFVWLAAAAVLLLLAFGFLWQRSNSGPQFSDYFIHFEQLDTFRGEDANAPFAKAMEAYNRRHYEEVYALLKQVENPDSEVYFFMGVSALAQEKTAEAITALKLSGTEPANRYYQQTRWYLALALWQSGRIEDSKVQLKRINEGEYQFSQAKKLLNKL